MFLKYIGLLLLVSVVSGSSDRIWKLDRIQTRTETKTQEEEVKSLLNRIILDHSHLFSITIQPDITDLLDKVKLLKIDIKIIFSANTYSKSGDKIITSILNKFEFELRF